MLADGLKEFDGDEAAFPLQRVAGFVPLGIVLAGDDVQEVAGCEAEVTRSECLFGREVGERFDYLNGHAW